MLECNGSGEITLRSIVNYMNSFGTGGILWAAGESIPVGHIKTINGEVFVCTIAHTSITGDVPNGDPTQPNQINWDPISVVGVPERGGIAWLVGVDYLPGDMVMSDAAGPGLWKQYYCITAHTSTLIPANDVTNWAEVTATADERGGIAWNTVDNYVQGDIVFDIIGDTPYVALTTVTDHVLIPSLNLTEWKAITGTSGSLLTADYRFSTLTAGDPTTGRASCNNVDNTLADVLRISQFDEDGIDRTYGLEALKLGDYVNYQDHGNDPDTYIYRVTADPINQGTYFEIPVVHHTSIGAGGLANNERMNVEVLYMTQHIPERGGVAWETLISYTIGDLVTIDREGYVCINDHISTTGDSANGDPLQSLQTNWVLQKGPHGYVFESGITFQPDLHNDDFFEYGLDGDATLAPALNAGAGLTGTIAIRQRGLGSHLVTWDTSYIFPGGLPTLSTGVDWVDVFDFHAFAPTQLVMEYVSSVLLVGIPPVVITDFSGTDLRYSEIVFDFTETPGETYDLYDSNGLVTSGINAGYTLTVDGTEDYYVIANNTHGSEASNVDSGTGVIPIVAITDFNATDGLPSVVTNTFTEQ